MFKAEVLSAVQKKTKVLADDGFAILVVEDCSSAATASSSSSWWPGGRRSSSNSSSSDLSSDWEAAVWYGDQQATAGPRADTADSSPSSSGSSSSSSILGVIEVGVQNEQDVLQHMPKGMETYAYISSMAVSSAVRRCGIGAALLQAAEQQAALWGQQLLALHVYETNDAAIKLYESHGLVSHAADPAWRRYVGGKVRQLMVKWL
jgi:ribosomal protein S18 acetylase RimI-like enzyme